MRLLNEMTLEERQWHERDKQYCQRCQRFARVQLDQGISTMIWNGEQRLPPRRFINAKMRVTAETWECPDCPKADQRGRERVPVIGVTVDFEHVGDPGEIVDL